MRRVNDPYKLRVVALGKKAQAKSDPFTISTLGDLDAEVMSRDVLEHVNKLLQIVFAIFCRLSLSRESDELSFPLQMYQELVLKNGLFDIAKLYDIAAIYGPDNKDSVRALIANVFDNDNRFFADFKESIDMMISHLKRCFTAALRVSEMSRGELVIDKSQAE